MGCIAAKSKYFNTLGVGFSSWPHRRAHGGSAAGHESLQRARRNETAQTIKLVKLLKDALQGIKRYKMINFTHSKDRR